MSEYFGDDWMDSFWNWDDSGSWFDDFGTSWFDDGSTSSDSSGMFGGDSGGGSGNIETLPTMTVTPDDGTTTEWDGFDDFGTSNMFFDDVDFGGNSRSIPQEPEEPPRWNENLPDPEDYSPTQDNIKAFIDLAFADETIEDPAEYVKGVADTYGVTLGDIIDAKRVEAEEAGFDPVELARATFGDLYTESEYYVEEDPSTQLQIASDKIAEINRERAEAEAELQDNIDSLDLSPADVSSLDNINDSFSGFNNNIGTVTVDSILNNSIDSQEVQSVSGDVNDLPEGSNRGTQDPAISGEMSDEEADEIANWDGTVNDDGTLGQLGDTTSSVMNADGSVNDAGADPFDFTEDFILQGLEDQISTRFNELIPSSMEIGDDGIRTYLDADGSGFTGEFAGIHLKDGRYDPEMNNLLGEDLGGVLQRIPVVNIVNSVTEAIYDELKDDRDWNELTPEGQANFINNMLVNNVAGSVVDSAVGLTLPAVDTISRFALNQTAGDIVNSLLSGDSIDDVINHTVDYWQSPDGLLPLVLDVGLLAASSEIGFPVQMIADQLTGALTGDDLSEAVSEFLITGKYEPVGGLLGTDVEDMNTLVPLESIGASPNVKFDSTTLDTLDGSSLSSMMDQFQESDVMKYMLTDTLPEGESYTFTEDRGEDGTFAVDKLGNVYVNDVRVGEEAFGEGYGTDWGFNTNGSMWSKDETGTMFVNGGQWSMSGYLNDGSGDFWSTDTEGNLYIQGVLQTQDELGEEYKKTWGYTSEGKVWSKDPVTGEIYENGQSIDSTLNGGLTQETTQKTAQDDDDLSSLDVLPDLGADMGGDLELLPADNTGGVIVNNSGYGQSVTSIEDLDYADLFTGNSEYPSYVEGTSSQVCPRPDLPNCGL